MTSSPIPAARSQYLLDLLAQVPDPREEARAPASAGGAARRRDRGGHRQVVRRDRAVGRRCRRGRAGRAGRGPRGGGGVHLPACIRAAQRRCARLRSRYLAAHQGGTGRRPAVIAIDGKTVRGRERARAGRPRIWWRRWRTVSARFSGRSPWMRNRTRSSRCGTCWKAFASLAAAVITIDAMHTQSDTAQVILSRGADYVMTVKGNMPTLYRQLKKLPWGRRPLRVVREHGPRPPGPPHHHGSAGARLDRGPTAPPRSRSCAARSRRTARRPSRSCT